MTLWRDTGEALTEALLIQYASDIREAFARKLATYDEAVELMNQLAGVLKQESDPRPIVVVGP